MGNLLSGKNIGIIGFGRIGRATASILLPLGCKIAFTDPVAPDSPAWAEKLPLNELLDFADIVTIHVSTKDMILGRDQIARMKKGGWLINVSRGSAVDEEALYGALQSGQLRGAAIDVFGQEPYAGKLRELPNAILTPHIGSYAVESRVEMETQSVENLLRGLREG